MHLCVAGWIEGGRVGYPTRFPSVKCGDNHVGLVMYKEPVDQGSQYDAYCYRLTGTTAAQTVMFTQRQERCATTSPTCVCVCVQMFRVRVLPVTLETEITVTAS